MKLRYLITLALFAGLLLPFSARADAVEQVTDFAQVATLEHSGKLTITDTIVYDFGAMAPHNVAYPVPLIYHDEQGNNFKINLTFQGAKLDGQAVALKPDVQATQAIFNLPAGSAAATTRTYILSYSLTPVVIKGVQDDILQRSVTGGSWIVPIAHASLRLETHIAAADNLTCYTGAQGSTNGACEAKQEGTISVVNSYAPLKPGEGLTIFTSFTSNSFASYLQSEAPPHDLTWLYALIVIVVVFISGIVVLLYTKTNGASKNQAKRD